MPSPSGLPVLTDPASLWAGIASVAGAWQCGALLLAFATAFLIARIVRPNLPEVQAAGIRKIGAGSASRLLLPLLFLLCAALASLVLSRFQAVPLLRIALPLITSFVVIRLSLYLLRHIMPPSPLLKAAERMIAYTIWVGVAVYLLGLFPELVATLREFSVTFGKQEVTLLMVLSAIFSVAITIFIALSLASLIEQRVMDADSVDMSSRVFIGKVVRALAIILAIFIALPLVGIDLTLLSVFGGALGVGLGLGLQKIASNYISGFIILLDHSVRLGDLVTIDNRHGVVKAIKSRYTVIRALDGTEAIIPNETLITNIVVNHSYTDQLFLVKIQLSVAYDCDLELAKRSMLDAAMHHQRVLPNPAPDALITALGSNGVELELAVWIGDADQGLASLRSDLLQAILTRFCAAGITVPFPQREIRIVGGNAVHASLQR